MLAVMLIIALLCGAVCRSLFEAKGRSGGSGFMLGFLLGPLGVLIAAVLSTDARELESSELRNGVRKRCPDCAESVLKEARKCKHCGFVLDGPGARESPNVGTTKDSRAGASKRKAHVQRMFRP